MSFQNNEENIEEMEYIVVENILQKRVTYEGKLEYFLKWKNLPDSENVWIPVEVLGCPEVGCPELIEAYEDSLKCESSGMKRKLDDAENLSSGYVLKKACVKDSNKPQMNISSLPEDVIKEIFSYLSQNELGCMAQVCKRWNAVARNPALWENVDIQFRCDRFSQKKVAENLCVYLPTTVTHLKLDFKSTNWEECLDIEYFCAVLSKICPSLKVLILHYFKSSLDLQSVLQVCRLYLHDLEVLSIHHSIFPWSLVEEDECIQWHKTSKIRILDLYNNSFLNSFCNLRFVRMPNLKRLNLVNTRVTDYWFYRDPSFLRDLEMLNVQFAYMIGPWTFRTLKEHAVNLTELYLCGTKVNDSDLYFDGPFFPKLKIICLRGCSYVTCLSIICLIFSCLSLQIINVDEQLYLSYNRHSDAYTPIGAIMKLKLPILKAIDGCDQHFENINYSQVH